jgi:hypothetical protein
MFGELPKLFDRNFAVGFFLPVAILISLSVPMLSRYIFSVDVLYFLELDLLLTTTVLGLLSWVGGIVLLAVNLDLYRYMEGYGTYNPLKLFGWLEKNRYQRTLKELEKLEAELSTCKKEKKEFPIESRIKRRKLVRRLAVEFPDQEEFLLPTPFGNALRSFEVFPRVMYGLDSIPAWVRLLAIIPKEYIEMIDGAKARVDYWVNLGLVFILLQIEYVGLVFATGNQLNWWVVGLWIMLGTIAPLRATSSAREWGDFVKSAFDVFAPKLREALGIKQPENRQEEFAQWQKFSQALIFRLPEQLPELKKSKYISLTSNKRNRNC